MFLYMFIPLCLQTLSSIHNSPLPLFLVCKATAGHAVAWLRAHFRHRWRHAADISTITMIVFVYGHLPVFELAQSLLLRFSAFCVCQLQDMLSRGRVPTSATAGAMLEGRRLRGDADACVSLAKRLLQADASPGRVGLNIVVGALAEAGRHGEAMALIGEAAADRGWQCSPDAIRCVLL